MATLTVWKFSDAAGAETALTTLTSLAGDGLITLDDAAVVSWPVGSKKPKTHEMAHHGAGVGAMGGAFWGFLFGLIFFIPILGIAIGAAAGALSGSLAHVGISEDFVTKVRSEVTPGTSALFAMTENAVIDKVTEAFKGQEMQLISTNMTQEQDAALREAFAN